MTKRIVSIFLCVVMLLASNTVLISAVKNSPTIVCNVSVDDAPKNAKFADLLVNTDETENNYDNLKKYGISSDCGIINRNNEFSSYTFKTLMSESDIELNDENKDGSGTVYSLSFGNADNAQQMKKLNSYKTVKLAYLDSDGNVISVTNAIKINNLAGIRSLKNITANANVITAHYSYNVFLIILIFAVAAAIVISIIAVVKKARFLRETQQ